MKLIWLVALTSVIAVLCVSTSRISAQPSKTENEKLENEIRKIDAAEFAAVLANDVPAIEKFWADDFIVNAPNNEILKGKKDAIILVKAGILDYESFTRNVEAVVIHGNTAIVMGQETVKPKGKAPFAGQTVTRRITNIWMKRETGWQLTARQATIIKKE